MMRPLLIALVVLAMFATLSASAQAEGLAASCNGSSIALSYAGYNFGTTPLVGIWRRNLTDCGPWTSVTYGVTSPMQWIELNATDSDALPDKLYQYNIGDGALAQPYGVDPIQYDGIEYQVAAFTGCGNWPVADGSVTRDSDGAAVYTLAVACPGSCYPTSVIWSGTEVVSDYLDGTPVTIYGSYAWTWQLSWAIIATSAQPGTCSTVGVDVRPWSALKQLYR